MPDQRYRRAKLLHYERSFITSGKYCFMSPTTVGGLRRVYIIDTVAGTATTADFNGVTLNGGQSFDSRTGTITFFGNYTNSAPPPTRIGDFFGVPNTDYASQWGRLGILPVATVGAEPATANPVYTGVGATFTSRGQVLRPDHGPDAGARNGPASANPP